MNILITAATTEELVNVRGDQIDLLLTGIGIANTAYSLTRHLCNNSYDLIINTGICGSFDKSLNIGDVVEVVEDCFSEIGFENDNEFLTFGDKILTKFVSKKKTHLLAVKGITVNTVHGNNTSIQKVSFLFNPDVESMEGAACMMVSKKFGIPCLQIRSISNYVEKRNDEKWNKSLALKNLHDNLEQIIFSL